MYEIQKFAIEKIYCAPSQDRQFNFRLARVTKEGFPAKRITQVYKALKKLPDMVNYFHVFVIGNLHPRHMNLKNQSREWYRDVWVNASDDMNERDYIFHIYNDKGVTFPREWVYYSFIDEGSMVIAIKEDQAIRRHFDVNSFKFLRVYSNAYFTSAEYSALPNKIGVRCELKNVATNTDKVALQNKIADYEQYGGKTMVYVNGIYTDRVLLSIPNDSFVEIVYDQSILFKEKHKISDMRTFESTKDNKLKYLLFRDKQLNRIQYHDDLEIYVSTDNEVVTRGLYFYDHKDYAVRNVTDKDYSLYTSFVNNQAITLSEMTTGSIGDKVLVVHVRKSGLSRELVYSSMKLHELYKLPQNVEHDVISNVNNTVTEFRAETLENSPYFQLASLEKMKDITPELSTAALGYNAVTYYYGYTPSKVAPSQTNVDVPFLYRDNSYAYEYDATGKMIGRQITNGPLYTVSSPLVKHVEFLKGTTPIDYGRLYEHNATITLRDAEYRVLSAFYEGTARISEWVDITETELCSVSGQTLTVNETTGKTVRVVYLDQPLTYSLDLPLTDTMLVFPIQVREDRGTGIQQHALDLPYLSLEVFLNGNRLTYEVDYFMNFPYINICNKTYLDYNNPTQSIHIRMHGFATRTEEINSKEIRGFVSHGTLTRNNYYDIKDDKVFSTFIGGKLYERSLITFSEEDNSVRTTHPLNGLPYTMTEPFIPVKEVTGSSSVSLYKKNMDINKRISMLYNVIYPEPAISPLNIVADHHYLFSPLVSKIIRDMISGVLPASIYTTPYNDASIHQLLDTTYKRLFSLDPIRFNLPNNLIEIHPDFGNATITLNLYQYRFITNVVRIITGGNPDKINLSGYVTVTAENNEVVSTIKPTPGGITVL